MTGGNETKQQFSLPIIHRLVKTIRSRWHTIRVRTGIALWVFLLLAGAFLLILADYLLRFPAWTRTIVLAAYLGYAAFTAFRYLLPLLKQPTETDAALRVESICSNLAGRFVTAFELDREDQRKKTGASEDLYRVVAARAEKEATSVDVDRVLPSAQYKRPFVLSLVGILLLLLPILAAGRYTLAGMGRLFTPWADINWPRKTRILLETSGPHRVRHAGTLILRGQAEGRIPSQGTIRLNYTGNRGTDRARFTLETDGSFEIRYRPMMNDAVVLVEAGDGESEPIEVRVVEPPSVQELAVDLIYPAYTRLEPERLASGHITALYGTDVTLTAMSTKPVTRASLAWLDADNPPLDLKIGADGRSVSGNFPLHSSGNYQIHLTDEYGFSADNPVTYTVEMIDNEYPRVELIEPRTDKEVTPFALIPVHLEVLDDYALQTVELAYAIDSATSGQISIPFVPGSPSIRFSMELDLENLELEAGSRLRLWVTAEDMGDHAVNREPARSREVILTLVRPDILRRRLNERVDRILQRVTQIQQLQNEAANTVTSLAGIVDAAPRRQSASEVRTVELRQEVIRRTTAQVALLLIDVAEDYLISRIGQRARIAQLRATGEILRNLAQENMPEASSRLQQAEGLLEDLIREDNP